MDAELHVGLISGSPYRGEPQIDDQRSRAAAETDFAKRNMRACRIAFITLTAATSLWPYLHWPSLSILHTTFACVTAVCVFEELRLARLLRRQLGRLKGVGSSSPPQFQS